jgi:hypothetical protein
MLNGENLTLWGARVSSAIVSAAIEPWLRQHILLLARMEEGTTEAARALEGPQDD